MENKEPGEDDFEDMTDGVLSDPAEYFFEYYDKNFWNVVAELTNLYHVQSNSKNLKANMNEILSFVGIEILMGTLKLPQAKMYWSRLLDLPLISDTLTRDRYFKLSNLLHFVNNLHDQDRSANFGKCAMKTYVPSKPNPLGLKNFILASSDGLVLDFIIYTGKGTVPDTELKEIGLDASVIKLLTVTVPNNGQHVIYSDRFFTGIKSIEFFLSNNIHQTGSVMKNRIFDVASKFKTDCDLNRGEWDEYVREDKKLCALKWKDNKAVILVSSFVGSEPQVTCKRWSKAQNRSIDVPQPTIVKSYNFNMGGIDLCDRFMAYYRSNTRTRKWTIRLFNHFIDLAIINCWIMYKRTCAKELVPKCNRLSLINFRLNVANVLIKVLMSEGRHNSPKK
ncbi:piggyBac transposable element-derived protein 3-like [Schistocerca serialis cubense]|uniref:piggyBac transposable element-derived protein 3-like n=1 Tax=Schistocerca serialis cubense TaxID=2023355 RepID=UPI00214EF789|nr:piggyBac transposable element-derived protein 3-like [Schistocerca serialis cubense]